MKKRCVILLVIIAVIMSFTSCQKPTIEHDLGEFVSQVSVKKDEVKISGEITYKNPTNIEFVLSSPEEISGLSASFVEDETEISFEKVKFSSSEFEQLFEKKNVLTQLFEVLKHFGSQPFLIAESGKISIDNQCSSGDYTVVFNCDNMKISTVSTDSYLYIFS